MNKYFILTFMLIGNLCMAQIGKTFHGTASYYANKFHGRKTATGEVFNNNAMTCACNQVKLGSIVRVTNLKNNKSVVLKVTDRLAASNHRAVDLTVKAAKELGFYEAGLAKVKVEVIEKKTSNENENESIQIDSLADSKKDTIFTTLDTK